MDENEIKIEDKIDFRFRQFETGLINGFGQVKSANQDITIANYELQSLKSFRDYIQRVKIKMDM